MVPRFLRFPRIHRFLFLLHFSLPRPLLSFNLTALMAVYAVKKGDESNDRLQSRFKKQVQEARFIKVLRERRTHKKKLTKRLERFRALKREKYRSENKKTQYYSNM